MRALTGAVALALTAFTAAAGAASLPPGPSSEILAPPDARVTPLTGSHGLPSALRGFSALACSAGDSCAAVGSYLDVSNLNPHAMAASESGGVWQRAVRVELPADASTSSDAQLNAVACPAARSCVAVGSYEGGAMAVQQSAGVWGRAVRLPGRSYRSLACSAPGSCVAVVPSGTGLDAVSQSAGTWGEATRIAMPPDALANNTSTLGGVACTASGGCVAVGGYQVAGGRTRPFAVSATAGVWSAAQAIALAPGMASDTFVLARSVACSAAGVCVAVGEDVTTQGRSVPISAAAVAGVFGPVGVVAPPPARSAASNGLLSVACAASGRCAAVGTSVGDAALADPGPDYALAVTGAAGTWGPISLVARRPDAAASRGKARLSHAACDGSGSCMALGTYLSANGRDETMAVSESGGTWGAPALVTPPPHGVNGGDGRAYVDLLACPGTGPCVAVGAFGDDRGPHLMSAGSVPTPFVPSTPPATGTVTLVASRIGARPGGRAIIRLACTGTASCKGRLKLTARRPARRTRRAGKASVVARKSFAIAPGTRGRVAIRLNARGRALLRAARSQLTATLTVLKTSPAPSQAKSRRIRLIKPRR